MNVGFEASDLHPERGGLYTYASQLLLNLAELNDPPTIILVNGSGRSNLPALVETNGGALPAERVIRARAWPLLHRIDGPWQRRYRSRHLAIDIDRYVLYPLWRLADRVPALAQWHLPRAITAQLDICHWPFEAVFLNIPHIAHVMTMHDLIVLRHPDWLTPLYVQENTHNLRQIARYATRIIADSEHTRRDAINLLGIPPERIDVIPLAAGPGFAPLSDRARADAVVARYGLRDGDYVFSWGIISERKNYVRLAAAFKAIIARNPTLTTRLVLAGDWGWLTESIKEGLAVLDLGERLVMPGRVPQDDLPALIHGARAVAYVSLYEGFGLPPLEAMACGTPVVASNTTSVPEVVGDAGLLVDPYKVADIAAALERVLTDDALRAELVARGLRRAADFSWTHTAELTMETYRRALATRWGEIARR